jgi:hypothetical protein
VIKGEIIASKLEAKLLSVIIDLELRYRNHIADTAAKGLKAALALKRLKAISPSSAQQLFNTTVVPIVDYALSVWMHVLNISIKRALNRVQRVGAQAITKTFQSVAVAIAEAEANIQPIH